MLDQLKIGNILFLDIETVPAYPSFDQVPENFRMLWEKKAVYLKKELETPEELYSRAGIFAEFGKIICITTGMIGTQEDKRVFRLKSFYGHDEKELLIAFADLITRLNQKREIHLCAHNGREFDFPYIARRLLIHGIILPPLLDTSGKRPWEVRQLDTMDLWKFGDHKHYTSLDLLATVFNIESPKSHLDGSQVGTVYWTDNDLPRIVAYCRHDVLAIAQLMLRFKGEELLNPEDLVILDNA
ncbi:MAG TPA: ribonuclease H-like domain-containing protein [Bacteroidales bacterium]|nr:ribonuclease H-like domain-containing protein [Bacteroidales bacterium]